MANKQDRIAFELAAVELDDNATQPGKMVVIFSDGEVMVSTFSDGKKTPVQQKGLSTTQACVVIISFMAIIAATAAFI